MHYVYLRPNRVYHTSPKLDRHNYRGKQRLLCYLEIHTANHLASGTTLRFRANRPNWPINQIFLRIRLVPDLSTDADTIRALYTKKMMLINLQNCAKIVDQIRMLKYFMSECLPVDERRKRLYF